MPYEIGGIEISDIDAKPIKVPVYAPVNNFDPVSNRLELAIISLMKFYGTKSVRGTLTNMRQL